MEKPAMREAARREVHEFFDGMMAAWNRRDHEELLLRLSRDDEHFQFGTDEGEAIVGFRAAAEAIRAMLSGLDALQMSDRDRRVSVSRDGSVSWFSYTLDITGVTGGEPFTIRGLRATGVAEKRDGRWVLVQGHTSMGFTGQVIKYPVIQGP